MSMPYRGKFKIASPFGLRTDPITGEKEIFHSGVDLVSLGDKTVVSVSSGTVVRSRIVTDTSDKTSEWGNYVAVQSNGLLFYYCHLSERIADVGDFVTEGGVIGVEGSTGRSTGSHLHLEIRYGEERLDPADYLKIPNVAGYIFSKAEDEGHAWSDDAVEWACENGIILGDGDGRLRLSDNATREEVAVMLYRTYQFIKGVKK